MKKQKSYMSKEARILRLFKEQKRLTQRELNRISYRYGSIIHTLRKEGHNIVTVPVDYRTGQFEYVYKGKKRIRKEVVTDDIVNFTMAFEEKGFFGKIKSKMRLR